MGMAGSRTVWFALATVPSAGHRAGLENDSEQQGVAASPLGAVPWQSICGSRILHSGTTRGDLCEKAITLPRRSKHTDCDPEPDYHHSWTVWPRGMGLSDLHPVA